MADSLSLSNAVKYAADSSAYLLDREGAVLPGEEIVVSDGQQPQMSALSLRGFGTPETDGAWSVDAIAQLDVRVRAVAPDERYWLMITAMPFEGGGHRASVSMSVNGGPPRQVLRSHGWSVIDVECQVQMVGRKGMVRVEFRIDNPSSPRALGLGGDDRTLGVKIGALRIADAAARDRMEASARLSPAPPAAVAGHAQKLPLVHRIAARSPILRSILLDRNPLVRLIRWMRRVSRSLVSLQEQMTAISRAADAHMLTAGDSTAARAAEASAAVMHASQQMEDMTDSLRACMEEVRELREGYAALAAQVAALAGPGSHVSEALVDLVTAAHVKLDRAGIAIDQGNSAIAHVFDGVASIAAKVQPTPHLPRTVLRKSSGWIVGTEFGHFSCDEHDDLLALCLVEYGDVERGLRLFLQKVLKQGDVFVDVGANIGLHTVVGAKAVGSAGRVFAIEAMPRTLDHLRASVRLSGVEDIVTILPFAAGARAEDGRELQVGAISGHSSLYALPGAVDAVRVDVRPLDLVVDTDRVTLVKIDVEGAELDVVAGMEGLLARCPDAALVLEYAESHLERVGTTPEAWETMRTLHGFSMYLIDDLTGTCEKIDDLAHLHGRASSNVLFCRHQSALVIESDAGREQ